MRRTKKKSLKSSLVLLIALSMLIGILYPVLIASDTTEETASCYDSYNAECVEGIEITGLADAEPTEQHMLNYEMGSLNIPCEPLVIDFAVAQNEPPEESDSEIEPTVFSGTSPSQLNALLAQGDVSLTTPGSGGYGIAPGTTLVIPEDRTLYVETILNVRRDATLIIKGTIVVRESGRLNSDGHATAGTGTIIIAEGGSLVNNGYVEIAQRSTLTNLGKITNNGTTGNLGRFEVRAGTQFTRGVVEGTRALTLHRDVITIP